MPRAFRRNATKFLVLFTFGALVFIILVRNKTVDDDKLKSSSIRDKNVDRVIVSTF